MADKESLNPGGGDGSGSPVIRISGRTAVQPARVVADLRAYWDELRQGRAVPTRADDRRSQSKKAKPAKPGFSE